MSRLPRRRVRSASDRRRVVGGINATVNVYYARVAPARYVNSPSSATLLVVYKIVGWHAALYLFFFVSPFLFLSKLSPRRSNKKKKGLEDARDRSSGWTTCAEREPNLGNNCNGGNKGQRRQAGVAGPRATAPWMDLFKGVYSAGDTMAGYDTTVDRVEMVAKKERREEREGERKDM